MSDQITLNGSLSDISLPILLMSLYRERETGILTLGDGTWNKSLYLSEGSVVYASSTDPDDGLLEALLRRGLLSLPHYLRAREATGGGRSVHQVLVDLGALGPEEVVEGVTQNLYDIAFSLFELRCGTYSLGLAPFSTLEMVTLSLDIPILVYKGMQRIGAWSQIYRAVGDPSTRLSRVRDLPSFVAELDMTSEDEHILALTKAGMSVSSIVDASYLPAFQTYRQLWIFLTLGLLERVPAEGPRRKPTPDDFEPLLERYNDLFSYAHSQIEPAERSEDAFQELYLGLLSSHPRLADGQTDLVRFGKIDVDLVLWNLRSFPEEERYDRLVAFLEETLYAFVLASQQHLSTEGHQRVLAYIRRNARSAAGDAP
ncbi:MAG: DUF4388 domain-containing protein [Acidobacteriota bacterium]